MDGKWKLVEPIDWGREHEFHSKKPVDACPFCREDAERLKTKQLLRLWRGAILHFKNAIELMHEWSQPFQPLTRKPSIQWIHPGEPEPVYSPLTQEEVSQLTNTENTCFHCHLEVNQKNKFTFCEFCGTTYRRYEGGNLIKSQEELDEYLKSLKGYT